MTATHCPCQSNAWFGADVILCVANALSPEGELAYIPERGMHRGARTHPNGVCTPYIPERGMYSFARVHTRTGYVHRTYRRSAYIPDRNVHRSYPTGKYRGNAYIPDRYVHRTYQSGMYSFALVRKRNVRKRGVSLDSKVQPRGSGFPPPPR